MKKINLQKGFTLIELLVVIAIIGILSSVVLASLNKARDKGADGAIKANLAGMKSQAAIVFDDNGNQYTTVCTDPTITAALNEAVKASGATALQTNLTDVGGDGLVTCHAGSNTWAVESPLKETPGTFFCVNDKGQAEITTGSSLLDSETDCSL